MAFFVDMKSNITTMNILQGQGLMITASKDKTIRVSETLCTSILYYPLFVVPFIDYCCFGMTIMIPFSYSYSMPGFSDLVWL